jgi:hypothetical protein
VEPPERSSNSALTPDDSHLMEGLVTYKDSRGKFLAAIVVHKLAVYLA